MTDEFIKQLTLSFDKSFQDMIEVRNKVKKDYPTLTDSELDTLIIIAYSSGLNRGLSLRIHLV